MLELDHQLWFDGNEESVCFIKTKQSKKIERTSSFLKAIMPDKMKEYAKRLCMNHYLKDTHDLIMFEKEIIEVYKNKINDLSTDDFLNPVANFGIKKITNEDCENLFGTDWIKVKNTLDEVAKLIKVQIKEDLELQEYLGCIGC